MELDKVAEVMVREILSSLDADASGVWVLDGDRLRLVAQRGFPERSLETIATIPLDAPLPTAEAARTRRVVVAVNRPGSEDGALRTLSELIGFNAGVAVPLLFRGKLSGVLAVVRCNTEPFDAEQVRIASALGDRFAAAVENARLVRHLRDALWLREAFLAAAAHELRTPATSLKSYAQLLIRRQGERSERERRTLEQIASLAERTAHLARELEEANALSRGLELHRSRVPLADLVGKVIDQVHQRAEHHRILLCAGEPVEVEVDEARLEMSLEALLENAIRYQPRGGAIHVTVGREDGRATIEVRDFGVGIPAARLPHVFEPLFEPWPPGSAWYTGVFGLGLFLARAVARAHGGDLVVRSREGEGSRFLLTLPLHRDQRGR